MNGYIKRDDALEIVRRTSGDYAAAFSEIRQLPAADVVPRAEVERLTVELQAMRGAANSYKMHYESLAREIFAEIEQQLRELFDFFRQDDDIRESCAIMLAISEIAKLEKKYTKENNQ